MKQVHDCGEIDLEKHALIEASAGTGKTYTIENLVVRLLEERADLGLENILLVTFTEKATSELKMRIREKIDTFPEKPGQGVAKNRVNCRMRWTSSTVRLSIRSMVSARRSSGILPSRTARSSRAKSWRTRLFLTCCSKSRCGPCGRKDTGKTSQRFSRFQVSARRKKPFLKR